MPADANGKVMAAGVSGKRTATWWVQQIKLLLDVVRFG
jgi:hypothetical protein